MPDRNRISARAWAFNTPLQSGATVRIASVYNQAGDNYAAYADGDPTQLFAFDGLHAYADRQVWALLEAKLADEDHIRDKCDIELSDGRHIALDFHLFAARELVSYFATNFEIEDLRGLDLFHSRFAPDAR